MYLFYLSTVCFDCLFCRYWTTGHRQRTTQPAIFLLTEIGSAETLRDPMLHLPVVCRVNCETLKHIVGFAMLSVVRGRICVGCCVFGLFLCGFVSICDSLLALFCYPPCGGVVSRARLHDACTPPACLPEHCARFVGDQ